MKGKYEFGRKQRILARKKLSQASNGKCCKSHYDAEGYGLPAEEQAVLKQVRTFMETKVALIITK